MGCWGVYSLPIALHKLSNDRQELGKTNEDTSELVYEVQLAQVLSLGVKRGVVFDQAGDSLWLAQTLY